MATPIRDIHHQGQLARKRKRAFLAQSGFFLLLIFIMMVGIVYIFFFSPLFTIRDISISGLSAESKPQALADIQSALNQVQLMYLKPNRNILFLNTQKLQDQMLEKLPNIKEVSVTKSYFHGIEVNFQQRELVAIWCFSDNECWYVDQNGEQMSPAPEASGFVFIQINDLRERDKIIDKKLFGPILQAVKKMSDIQLPVRAVLIPTDSFTEFRATTSNGYDVIFDIGSNLAQQLEVLRVFWGEMKKDPLFNPQYIDLRIEGRVYYR